MEQVGLRMEEVGEEEGVEPMTSLLMAEWEAVVVKMPCVVTKAQLVAQELLEEWVPQEQKGELALQVPWVQQEEPVVWGQLVHLARRVLWAEQQGLLV